MDHPAGEMPAFTQSIQYSRAYPAQYHGIIEERSDEVIQKWKQYFGEARYFC
jgi:hypothetical protein